MDKADEYETPIYVSDAMRPTGSPVSPHVSTMVLTAVRWVVAMDLYQEVRDSDYAHIAKDERQRLDVFLTPPQRRELVRLHRQVVAPYWRYERDLKRKIREGHVFSNDEIQESVVKRSQDAILYGFLARCVYGFPEQLIEVVHVRQALEDIEDCFLDFVEDVEAGEPNIFSMYLLGLSRPRDTWPETVRSLRHEAKFLDIEDRLSKFVRELYQRAKATPFLDLYPRLEKELDREYLRFRGLFGKRPDHAIG